MMIRHKLEKITGDSIFKGMLKERRDKSFPRYKWDKACPDCGATLSEEIGSGHPNSLRKIYIDCLKCSYSATGWLNPRCKRHYMYGWFTGQRKPDVGIWSETRPGIEKINDNAKWAIKRIDELTELITRGEVLCKHGKDT